MTRRSGRHPEADGVRVRFVDDALDDLRTLMRKGDPQVVRWALKKCLMLEQNPEAGETLSGPLVGYRKLVVGDRDWRLVWRVTHDEAGGVLLDIAEIWGFGARHQSEVYAEVQRRVQVLGNSPHTVPLAEAIEALGRSAYGLTAASEPAADETPQWLVDVLVKVVGMRRDEVDTLSSAQAHALWDAYTRTPRA